MLGPFAKLGNTIAQAWEKAGRDNDAFVDIATNALVHSQVLSTVEPGNIAHWLMSSQEVPEQYTTEFGQPPINVFVGDGFYIQVLFWLDGTTAIHEHSFAGAFGVLSGSSVQSTYSFEPQLTASPRLLIGRTTFLSSELLHRGDIRPIYSGDKLIHSLFHLDRPSLSLVVRTSAKTAPERPQYAYLRPHLAFDDLNPPKLQAIQLRMLESLLETDPAAFWQSAGEIVSSCDPFMLSEVLGVAYHASDDRDNWNGLLDRVGPTNKGLVEYILPCLIEGSRINRIVGLRKMVHDPVHRFFLALLLNVPAREEIYKLIALRFPLDDPQSLALRWMEEIFAEQRLGIRLTPPLLFIIRRILQDPDFEQSRPLLSDYFQVAQGNDLNKLKGLWRQLSSVDVFKPLFTTMANAN